MKKAFILSAALALVSTSNSWGMFIVSPEFCHKYHIVNSPTNDSRLRIQGNTFELFGENSYGVDLVNCSEQNISITYSILDCALSSKVYQLVPGEIVTIKGIQGVITIEDPDASKKILVVKLWKYDNGNWKDAASSEGSASSLSYVRCFEPRDPCEYWS